MNIAILGNHHDLSMAELESVLLSAPTTVIEGVACFDESAPDINALGGVVKFAKQVAQIPGGSVADVAKHLQESLPKHLHYYPEDQGKLTIGLSWYGYKESVQELSKVAFATKKAIKTTGRSVRIVPNKFRDLNAASVRSNKLHIAETNGIELIIIRQKDSAILATTEQVQDINAYADRDQKRPLRDAYVGMLPPKLAQIMINLTKPTDDTVVADIFCGTGVVLQEALLMGHDVFGSDLSEKMVEYTTGNLKWLFENYPIASKSLGIVVSDARETKVPTDSVSVVSEMFLGEPLTTPPSDEKLEQLLHENKELLVKTLKNLSSQQVQGSRVCLALPAWRHGTDRKFVSLPLEKLKNLGYNLSELTTVDMNELIYARPDQIVGRKLLLLTKG